MEQVSLLLMLQNEVIANKLSHATKK